VTRARPREPDAVHPGSRGRALVRLRRGATRASSPHPAPVREGGGRSRDDGEGSASSSLADPICSQLWTIRVRGEESRDDGGVAASDSRGSPCLKELSSVGSC
jgi:hypothetical protein